MSNSTTTEPRIYVACLASYKVGRLHGQWINADQAADCILEEIQAMLKASPEPHAEEWAIHDSEGFADYYMSECETLATIATLGQLISQHGPAVGLYLSHTGCDVENLQEQYQDSYYGQWDSEEDFAYQWHENCDHLNGVPDFLRNHIDWDSVARDMFLDGFFSGTDENGCLHVFDR